MLRDRDSRFDELATAANVDALCQLLLASPYDLRRSSIRPGGPRTPHCTFIDQEMPP